MKSTCVANFPNASKSAADGVEDDVVEDGGTEDEVEAADGVELGGTEDEVEAADGVEIGGTEDEVEAADGVEDGGMEDEVEAADGVDAGGDEPVVVGVEVVRGVNCSGASIEQEGSGESLSLPDESD